MVVEMMDPVRLREALDYFEREWKLNGRPYLWDAGQALASRPVMFAAARAFLDLIENGGLRVFIGKHRPDAPYIVGTDPDPRDDAFKERYAGFEGEDYSGWYVKAPKGASDG